MRTKSTFFKTTAILSTALFSLLGGCLVEDQVDYTTDYGSSSTTVNQSDTTWKEIQFGSSDYDYPSGIITDRNGNIYVTGTTNGDLDGQTNAVSGDMYVGKFDKFGKKQWVRQLGSDSFLDHRRGDSGEAIATDFDGNIYVTGRTNGNFDGGKNLNEGVGDVFVVKYDRDGNKMWSKQIGPSQGDYAYDISVSSSEGNAEIYVTGTTNGSFDGNSFLGDSDVYIMKYDSSGNKMWSKQIGTTKHEGQGHVATDFSGNVYVSGTTNSNFDTHSKIGSEDIFLVKYDKFGSLEWSKQIGSTKVDYASWSGSQTSDGALATDSKGNIYVAGRTSGSFEGETFLGVSDVYIVKYSPTGSKEWSKQFGTEVGENFVGINVDPADNVYILGSTSGSMNGNTHSGLSCGWMGLCTELFVSKFDQNGLHQWTTQIAQPADSDWALSGGDITSDFDSDKNIYITGTTHNVNAGVNDVFIMKFTSDGIRM